MPLVGPRQTKGNASFDGPSFEHGRDTPLAQYRNLSFRNQAKAAFNKAMRPSREPPPAFTTKIQAPHPSSCWRNDLMPAVAAASPPNRRSPAAASGSAGWRWISGVHPAVQRSGRLPGAIKSSQIVEFLTARTAAVGRSPPIILGGHPAPPHRSRLVRAFVESANARAPPAYASGLNPMKYLRPVSSKTAWPISALTISITSATPPGINSSPCNGERQHSSRNSGSRSSRLCGAKYPGKPCCMIVRYPLPHALPIG
ncbi:hypothetical protein BMS3Abin12_00797 [bacterium BMS3Abin12]|nr:hypothetical protein BMS3Abin12_00797 [bacterium BMS3Abin12]GBE51020.1 hypothetical protein BMS3Bbin13_01973 [bacterium BMS3Bbin13]